MTWTHYMNRAVGDPRRSWNYFLTIVKGQLFSKFMRLTQRRVSFGNDLRIAKFPRIKGPGTVIIGDKCKIDAPRYCPVTPYTHSKEARIEIGDNVHMNGTRFGCRTLIRIGNGCLLADARITDTDYHDVEFEFTHTKHRSGTRGKSAPIIIEENAWVGTEAIILKGVTIGKNSMVAARAVVARDVPANVLVAGNPAVVVKKLNQ